MTTDLKDGAKVIAEIASTPSGAHDDSHSVANQDMNDNHTHVNVSKECQKPFRFLDLPPEIRDIIYEFHMASHGASPAILVRKAARRKPERRGKGPGTRKALWRYLGHFANWHTNHDISWSSRIWFSDNVETLCLGQQTANISLPIFNTNKQIRQEAHHVYYGNSHFGFKTDSMTYLRGLGSNCLGNIRSLFLVGQIRVHGVFLKAECHDEFFTDIIYEMPSLRRLEGLMVRYAGLSKSLTEWSPEFDVVPRVLANHPSLRNVVQMLKPQCILRPKWLILLNEREPVPKDYTIMDMQLQVDSLLGPTATLEEQRRRFKQLRQDGTARESSLVEQMRASQRH